MKIDQQTFAMNRIEITNSSLSVILLLINSYFIARYQSIFVCYKYSNKR